MRTHTSATNRERGFTLIELMVVAIVFAVLSAVSVPIYLNHRAKSDVESVAKDAEQAALALTSRLTGSGTLPATLDADNPDLWGYKASSPDNRLIEYAVAEDRFRLCILNVATNPDAWAVYASATEKVTSGTGTEPTGACDGDASAPALAAEPTRGPSTPIATPTPTAVPTVTPPAGFKCHTFTSTAGATGTRDLSWAAVANATDYRVKQYRNGVLASTTTVSGTSFTATDTAPDTWQYTVDAHGPGFSGPCSAPAYTPPPADVAPGAPSGVTATAVPGEDRATVSWSTTATATAYQVYLDGATTPDWTGSATTAVINGLATGSHTVAVSAKSGTAEGPQSSTMTFTTINNDNFAAAQQLTPPASNGTDTTTIDFSNATATTQAGETNTNTLAANRTLWWYFTAPSSQTYTLQTIAPTTGAGLTRNGNISIWQVASAPSGSNSTPPATTPSLYSENGTPPSPSASGMYDETAIAASAGTIYAVRVSQDTTTATGRFRIVMKRSYSNDSLVTAKSWVNTFGTSVMSDATGVDPSRNSTDPGDAGNIRSAWYKYPANATGYLCVQTLDSASNPATHTALSSWATTSSTVAGLGSANANSSGTGYLAVPIINGTTYTIRISTRAGSGLDPYNVQYFRASNTLSCAPQSGGGGGAL